MSPNAFLPPLRAFLEERVLPHIGDEPLAGVPGGRAQQLSKLADFIRTGRPQQKDIELVYICTHNSRRSHLGQIWAAVAAHHHGLAKLRSYSGGTEITAMNPRVVSALRRAGFSVDGPGGDNPHYAVRFSEHEFELRCYSKLFDDPSNPRDGFAAVMTCSSADAACPVVPGAALRVVTPFEDPKRADGTASEAMVYDERLVEIAVETFRVFRLAAS